MPMDKRGFTKLGEELSELLQVVMKKMACMDDDVHWDGSHLPTRLETEMGDVIGALKFVIDKEHLDYEAIMQRAEFKHGLFVVWDHEPPEM